MIKISLTKDIVACEGDIYKDVTNWSMGTYATPGIGELRTKGHRILCQWSRADLVPGESFVSPRDFKSGDVLVKFEGETVTMGLIGVITSLKVY